MQHINPNLKARIASVSIVLNSFTRWYIIVWCAYDCAYHAVRRFIELDEDETVESVTQHDIVQSVDITSAQKVLISTH